ncbi:MAG: YraN family protein [Butyrivibrio sp.]|nr:YraN family protein [Butyrivibrio sp.]
MYGGLYSVNKRRIGDFYEDIACKFIYANGGSVLERNYRVRHGEIDIIARDEDYLCFIEVKYRNSDRFGPPEKAVNISKQRQICRISKLFLFSRFKSIDLPIRYDVIAISGVQNAVTVKWLKNAFEYIA